MAVDNGERGQELLRQIAEQQEYPPPWNSCGNGRRFAPARRGRAIRTGAGA
jgi:hypothetical protein